MMSIALAAALVLGVGAQARAGDGPQNARSNALQGTWRVQVTLRDCTTNVPRPAFYSYLSFGSAGTLIETTNNAGFEPGQRSAGHGVWAYAGHRTFSASSEAFIQFTSAPNPPASPGFLRGVQRIDQTITMQKDDPNTFDSVAAVRFFDVTGTELLSACATAIGQRYQ
jgi:hypothetical protein